MITRYILTGHENARTRKELSFLTGIPDREVRKAIHLARRNVPIINLQDGKGYFIPDMTKPLEISYLKAYIKQEESRLKSIGWALKSARALIKEASNEEL